MLAAGFESRLPADEKTDEPSRYTRKRIHDPNGIGKFYMGREIARVMGFGGVLWLERPQREREEKLSLLIKGLDLKPGMVVADIGAGSGVVSFRVAEHVAPGGKVLAVDIQKEMLDRLKARAKKRGIKNVEPIKGTNKSPKLPEGKVDLVVMVDVYHEFDFPYEMLLEISKSLKPGGRVAFVEYRMEDRRVPIKLVHKMSEAQVKKEALQPEFGLKWKETIGTLPRQHIVVFEKKKDDDDSEDP
jgi:SAM-dependent methyltransferase